MSDQLTHKTLREIEHRLAFSYNEAVIKELEKIDACADAWERDILGRDTLKRANEYNIKTIEYLRKELKKQRKLDKKADLNPYTIL